MSKASDYLSKTASAAAANIMGCLPALEREKSIMVDDAMAAIAVLRKLAFDAGNHPDVSVADLRASFEASQEPAEPKRGRGRPPKNADDGVMAPMPATIEEAMGFREPAAPQENPRPTIFLGEGMENTTIKVSAEGMEIIQRRLDEPPMVNEALAELFHGEDGVSTAAEQMERSAYAGVDLASGPDHSVEMVAFVTEDGSTHTMPKEEYDDINGEYYFGMVDRAAAAGLTIEEQTAIDAPVLLRALVAGRPYETQVEFEDETNLTPQPLVGTTAPDAQPLVSDVYDPTLTEHH